MSRRLATSSVLQTQKWQLISLSGTIKPLTRGCNEYISMTPFILMFLIIYIHQ